jgi:hypothetical protein
MILGMLWRGQKLEAHLYWYSFSLFWWFFCVSCFLFLNFLFIPNNFFPFSQNSNFKEFIVYLNTNLLTSKKKKKLTWKFKFSNTWKLIEGAHKLDIKTNEMEHVCSQPNMMEWLFNKCMVFAILRWSLCKYDNKD